MKCENIEMQGGHCGESHLCRFCEAFGKFLAVLTEIRNLFESIEMWSGINVLLYFNSQFQSYRQLQVYQTARTQCMWSRAAKLWIESAGVGSPACKSVESMR